MREIHLKFSVFVLSAALNFVFADLASTYSHKHVFVGFWTEVYYNLSQLVGFKTLTTHLVEVQFSFHEPHELGDQSTLEDAAESHDLKQPQ